METAALVAPVTALEFLNEEYLLAGEGPNLTVYSLQLHPRACTSLSVLQHYRIHGIRPRLQATGPRRSSASEPISEHKHGRSSTTEPNHYDLVVFGGKAVRLVRLTAELHSGDHLRLEALGPLTELHDWALDVRWLSGEGRPLLGVALAHNSALLLDAREGKALVQCSCLEGCLLYSALLLVDKSWVDSVLVGGTVFNQLVLWRPGGGGGGEGSKPECKAPVERRLLGHSGVIFSISFLQERGWLASASDDRSVRVWAVGVLGGPGGKCGEPNPTCLRVLYGHQARVFSVHLSLGKVYSAGEDGACLVWDWAGGGKVVRTLKGHRAGGVRSLAVSEGKTDDGTRDRWVATGGADGGVRLWRVEGNKEEEEEEEEQAVTETLTDLKFAGQGTPKAVCVVGGEDGDTSWNHGKILVCTDRGVVYQYRSRQWEVAWQGAPEFQSYSVMETLTVRVKESPSNAHLCAVGNLIGGIQVFPISQPQSGVALSGGQGKIHSLIWVEDTERHGGYLLASGAAGLVRRWYVEVETGEDSGLVLNITPLPPFLLPPCAKRWLTAAVRLHPGPQGALWACGDRRGSLLLFQERGKSRQKEEEEGLDDNKREGDGDEESNKDPPVPPTSCLFGVHGKQGVTSVLEYQGLLYSTGRDGCVRVFRVRPTPLKPHGGSNGSSHEATVGAREGLQLEVLRVQRACKGMEWLERILILEPERSAADLPERGEDDCKNSYEMNHRVQEEEMHKGTEARFVIAGFHAVHFVVWDPVRQERLLAVPCGGGHRSWNLWPRHEGLWPGYGALVFIKQGAVLASQPPGEAPIWAGKAGKTGAWGLREGVHGRGIGCVCRLGRIGGTEIKIQTRGAGNGTGVEAGDGKEVEREEACWEILVTGGEDTSLTVLAVQPASGSVHVLSVITDHISSVRTLTAVTSSEGGASDQGTTQTHTQSLSALLVSAGGRAQMQCYRLLIGWDGQRQVPSCQVIQVASHRLDEQWERRRNRHKTVKLDPETRYMSVAVLKEESDGVVLALACSDGAIRLFFVSEVKGHIDLLWESFYHQRCVLSVATCSLEDRRGNRHKLLFTAATDGNIAVWDATALSSFSSGSLSDAPTPPMPRLSIPAHQSGVNSLAVWAEKRRQQEDGCQVTVASGGDDGQLTVSVIRVQCPEKPTEGGSALSQHREELSHPRSKTQISESQDLPRQAQFLQQAAHSVPLPQRQPQVKSHPQSPPSPPLSQPPPHPHGPHPQPRLPHALLHLSLCSQSRVPLAHAAPLTALSLLSPGLLASASPDQRVCLWTVCSTAVGHGGALYSHVADAAGLSAWEGGTTGEIGRDGGSEAGSGSGIEESEETRGGREGETVGKAVGETRRETVVKTGSSETGFQTGRMGWVLVCGQGFQLLRVRQTDGGLATEGRRHIRNATDRRVKVTFQENTRSASLTTDTTV
ncbi:tRNA (34-2'-O)-methyltransferase regulator WDR6 [Polymixia lowei]